jgi:hypothetical protein
MTHPRRKLDPLTVQQIRKDYRARRDAERLIEQARTVLQTTPDAMNWARTLGVSQNTVLHAATLRTYKDIPYPGY